MQESVLFVDDEENILNALSRVFGDTDLRVLRASNAEAALALLQKEEIAVIVSDNMMPGMRGLELLEQVSRRYPDTLKVLMTAHADLATALDAINKGEVYRFVVKPWENELLVRIVEEGVQRYRLSKAVNRKDEDVLRSLAQTIELKDPYTKGHCDRVADYALMMAEALRLPEAMMTDIKYGSWLHDCGKIGVPEEILNFNGPLDKAAFDMVKKHPQWGAEVATHARLSQTVINIVLYHHERIDGNGYPTGLNGSAIPLEARIVAVADVYDALITDRPYRPAFTHEKVLEIMHSMTGTALDPEVVRTFVERISLTA